MKSWTDLTEAYSQLPYIQNLTDVKQQLDSLKPFSQEVEGHVMQKIKLDWNFHSNAIEGNKLTRGETYSVLMYDLAASGKTVKDHTDIKGHNKAIDFIATLVDENIDLAEIDIRNLHKIVLQEPYKKEVHTSVGVQYRPISIGEYKKMPNNVKTITDEIHFYADPQQVPILMGELVSWYNEARKNEKIHPSVLAAFFHHQFVKIHPFDDGNGRLSRILMNLILMQKGYPPAIVKYKDRVKYYSVLNQADKDEYPPLFDHIAEAVSDSLNLYFKAARGENIEDADDLDKEIALFKQGFGKSLVKKSPEIVQSLIDDDFKKLITKLIHELKIFDELFREQKNTMLFAQFRDSEIIQGECTWHSISSSSSLIDSLNFQHFLIGFNKTKKSFDLYSRVEIYMRDEYEYKINYYDISQKRHYDISKNYDERISESEMKHLIKKIKERLLTDLKNKIEETK